MRKDPAVLAPIVAVATLVTVFVALRLPPPKGEDASLTSFSAARAKRQLDSILSAGVPHPIGTPQNAAVRDAIVSEIEKLGYEPVVEKAFVCGRNLTCGEVENIVARPRGDADAPAVFLVSHYDSVLAAPGAADDLSGVVASLEVLRILAAERHRNPVCLLVTDGEEAGLLGAEAFATRSAFVSRARAVINLEARGTSGTSFLFETSDDNAWLVSRLARALPRPSTSSLFYTVYKSLPNDTDFSVLKRRGIPGVNFAFIGSPLHYHTPLDTPGTLSLHTLQHHGENALAAARALADSDLEKPPKGNAVWFSVLDRFIVSWPEPWTLPFALVNLGLFGFAAWRLVRSGELRIGGLLGGTVWFLASLAVAGLLVSGGTRLLGVRFGERVWLGQPLPLLVFAWLVPIAVTMFLATLRANRYPPVALLSGAAIVLGLSSAAAAHLAPGVSFLLLAPGAAVTLALLARAFGAPLVWGQSAAAAIAGVVLFPLGLMLYESLGLPAMPGIALVAVLVSAVSLPGFASGEVKRLQVMVLVAVAGLVSFAAAFLVPAENPAAPAPANIVLRQSGEKAEWLVPREVVSWIGTMKSAVRWETAAVPLLPWSTSASHLSAPAGRLGEDSPKVELLAAGDGENGRLLSIRVTSPRGALRVRVAIEDKGAVQGVSVEGEPLDIRAGKRGSWLVFRNVTLPAQGMRVEVRLGKGATLKGYVLDESPGLPPEGEALVRARGDRAVPVHDGDRTLMWSEFSF